MKITSILRTWIRTIFHGERVRDEANEELAFHLEARAEDLERNGLSAPAAQRQARVEMGSSTRQGERYREAVGLRWLDELGGDLRYAWRMLWRSKGFTAVAVGSLALGIGANTIIFSLAKGVLLDRLAVPHPEQLRLLAFDRPRNSVVTSLWGNQTRAANGLMHNSSFSYPAYELLRQQNIEHPVLSDLFAFKDMEGPGGPTLTVDGQARLVNAEMGSGNYFQQLQVQPEAGRVLLPADDAPDATPAMMISDGLWSGMFGRAPGAIGRTVAINSIPVTIVGVTPPEFTGAADVQRSPEIFFPMHLQPTVVPQSITKSSNGSLLDDKRLWWVQIMGRALPGVSQERVRAALKVWLEQDIRATMPVAKDATFPIWMVDDGGQGMAGNMHYAQPIYVLSALAGFVLLLACANLANLLLARSSARQREMAVRLALGASHGRVLRQVLTESLLLSTLGGMMGLALGYAGRNVVPHLLSASWRPAPLTGRIDLGVLVFTVAISLMTGVLFGLAPAWRATRVEVNAGLKDATNSATRRRKGLSGKALVVLQVSLSMILVVGAGLFAMTLSNLDHTKLGFHPENLLLFSIQATPSRYPPGQNVVLHQRIEARLRRIPGMESVTAEAIALVGNAYYIDDVQINGEKKAASANNAVGKDFFTLYQIPLRFGRSFDASDTTTSPKVAVVNETFVRKYFAGTDPISKTFSADDGKSETQIIGVVADARYADLKSDIPATFYTLYEQASSRTTLTYVLKTPLPASAVLPQIRSALAEIDKDLPLRDVHTQTEEIAATISQERLFATLTSAFGVLALVLACIGIYGLMAYDVARRTSEIGIRMALGAQAGRMMTMVLREATWMAVAGVGIGLTTALWLAKFVKSMLYGLAPNDPWVLGGAAAILLLVALAAGFGPARRAARVEPMVALRHE